MLAIIATALTGCGFDITTTHDPVSAFETTFGISPPTDITDLRGQCTAFRDSGHAYLRFTASEQRLIQLLGTNFNSIAGEAYTRKTESGSITGPTPAWWQPLPTATAYWESQSFHPTFSAGKALVSYDSTASTVHIYWDGYD